MGTPHRGSSYADLGLMAKRAAIASGFDANDKLLRDLKFDSQMLEILRADFSLMVDETNMYFHSFQEAQGFKGSAFAGGNRKVW